MTAPSPISAEARGRLRELWGCLEAAAITVEASTSRIPREWAAAAALKGKVGADRAMTRILAAMPIRPFHVDRRSAAFRYLLPRPALPPALGVAADAADAQPVIIVNAVLVNAANRPRLAREPFGLAITFHALGRLLDRSVFTADPTTAMFEAHDALLALPTAEGNRIFDLDRLPLPARGGAFIASPRRVGKGESPLAVCRTWIGADQTRPEQDADLLAWRALLAPVAA